MSAQNDNVDDIEFIDGKKSLMNAREDRELSNGGKNTLYYWLYKQQSSMLDEDEKEFNKCVICITKRRVAAITSSMVVYCCDRLIGLWDNMPLIQTAAMSFMSRRELKTFLDVLKGQFKLFIHSVYIEPDPEVVESSSSEEEDSDEEDDVESVSNTVRQIQIKNGIKYLSRVIFINGSILDFYVQSDFKECENDVVKYELLCIDNVYYFDAIEETKLRTIFQKINLSNIEVIVSTSAQHRVLMLKLLEARKPTLFVR